jgi:hypothetical protein
MGQPINVSTSKPTQYSLLAAGTYDLVALCPNPNKACARKIVALAADAGWTLTDQNAVATGPIAVPVNFIHEAHTANITCASPIAVYW